MQPTSTTLFQVRHYECDALGHLNNANYLRYMEEAAFNASAEVGYPKARYEDIGYLWLARETEIEFLQPLRYGDIVEVKTWVGDLRRVRSIRRYEFRVAGSEALYARASTDWVYIQRDSGRPSALPPEMVTAFSGDAPLEAVMGGTRDPFPAPPPPPAGAFTLRRRVEWRDIDTAQHVNNAVYLSYTEDCGIQAGRAFGWPMARMREAGWGIIARSLRIEYRLPAALDDDLDITTWVYDMKRVSGVRYYAITRSNERGESELLAQVQALMVCADVATGKPMRVPQDFLQDVAGNIVS